MAFVQIIDMHTSEFEKINQLEDEWRSATEGKRTARRAIITTDRNDPNRHLVMVFFDSYEDAMKKLSTGPGNLVRQTEMLKELGAKTNKTINPALLGRAIEEQAGS